MPENPVPEDSLPGDHPEATGDDQLPNEAEKSETQNDTEKPAKKTESDVSKSNTESETQQLAYDRKVAQTLKDAMHFLLSEIKKYKLDEELPNINTKALMI